MAKAIGQFTIIDFNDIDITTLAPANPAADRLWLDTSVTPNRLKRWNGSAWVESQALTLAQLDAAQNDKLNAVDSQALRTGMGVDSNCTALFHFDDSLKSHKGLDASFTRASEAYLGDGTLVASGLPRYEVGKFGKGIMIEEGTANTVNQTDANNFNKYASIGAGYLGNITDEGDFLKIVATEATTTGKYLGSIVLASYAANDIYVVSMVLKLPANCGVTPQGMSFRLCNSTSSKMGKFLSSVSLGSDEYLVSFTQTSTTAYTNMNLMIDTRNNATHLIGDYFLIKKNSIQLEQKPYATSFIDGTRQPEALYIPTAGVFEKSNWTIALTHQPTSLMGVGNITKVLWACVIDANNYYQFIIGWVGEILLRVCSGGVLKQLAASAASQTIGTNNSYVITGDGTMMTLTVNGVTQSLAYVEPVGTLPTNMYIGSSDNGLAQANGIIDELRIDKVARTATEIKSWYLAQSPFYATEEVAAALSAAATAQETADGEILGFFQTTVPTTGMSFGDIWINIEQVPPDTTDIYRFQDANGGSQGTLAWTAAPDNAIGKVYLNAYNAQVTANSKIKTFYQATIPTSETAGDMWVDTDDSNKSYRAACIGANEIKAGEWVLARDTGITTTLDGTAKYRTAGAPTNNPNPTAIDVDKNTDGSIDVKLSWAAYTQGAKQADMLMLFWKKGSAAGLGAPTVNDSSIAFNVNTGAASFYRFEGIPSDKYYSFGIAAARRTENGLEIGTIQSKTSAPNWQDITQGTPDYLGNVAGTPAGQMVNYGMGVDADCTLLCHFDGSLNSHKGLTPAFVRNSVAYLSDGTQVAAGQARFEAGKFGKGIMIEEGTTNLLTANQSSVETDTAGWVLSGCATRSNGAAFNGSYGIALTNPASPQECGLCNINGLTGSATYTISFWAKSSLAQIRVGIVDLNGTTRLNNDAFNIVIYGAENANLWNRYTFTRTIAANADGLCLRVICGETGNTGVCYLDCFQIEQKPYATSWQIGGTARPAEVLTVPTAGIFEKGSWTVGMVYIPTAVNTGGDNLLWSMIVAEGVNAYYLYVSSGGALKVDVYSGNVRYLITTSSGYITIGKTYDIKFSGDGAYLRLYCNGLQIGTDTAYIEPIGMPISMAIGCRAVGINQVNGIIDELRIDKVARTAAEIKSWYNAKAPFYSSDDIAQLPGYLKAETDGWMVYDSSNALRVLVGSWLKDAVRKYGIKIIDGEIHSSNIYGSNLRTGAEGATTYINLSSDGVFSVVLNGKTILKTYTGIIEGGTFYFYKNSGEEFGRILHYDDAYPGFTIEGHNGTAFAPVTLRGSHLDVIMGANIYGNLSVIGDITKTGEVHYAEPTENYGTRLLNIVETPEHLYYDRGVVSLVNGEATIIFDPIFLECIEPDTELTPWQIWAECYGKNSVYVSEVGTDYFKVKERNAGISNNKVIWRFEATRKNYAGIRLREEIS